MKVWKDNEQKDKKTLTVVVGGSGSGKSAFAEQILCGLPAKQRFYVAAMEPYGEEGARTIARHQALRAGKDFATVEKYRDVGTLFFPADSAVLLECLSNLAANELFGGPVELTEENAAALAEKTADKITADLFRLRENCGHLVLVTNDIFADRDGETTLVQAYKQVLGTVYCWMAAAADTVIEVTAGIADVWKGAERRSADYECVE